jgi:uridine kinase
MDDLLDRIVALRAQRGRSVAVAISGIDCAGKSTLTDALAARLAELELPVLVIPCDEFTRPASVRFLEPDEGLAYYRDSYAYDELFARILPFVRGGSTGELTFQVADWEHDGWKPETVSVAPGTVVLCEGCFLITEERAPAFDLTAWIDLPLEGAIQRAIGRQRDLDRMGGPDGVRERYTTRYLPGQALHLAHDDPRRRADIVLAPESLAA